MEIQAVANKKQWLIPASLIAIFIVAIAAYFLVNYLHPYSYKYNQVATYQLADAKHHAGISVLKPIEFQQQPIAGLAGAKILLKPTEARFTHYKKARGQQAIIAQMALNSVFKPAGVKNLDNLQLISRLMMDSKDTGHAAVVAPIQNYVRNLLNPDLNNPVYQFSFNQPKQLKNLSSAWEVDFSATAKNPKVTTPDMQGLGLEAYGKNGQYFMVLASAQANWQSNQATWQKIITSLKIDQ